MNSATHKALVDAMNVLGSYFGSADWPDMARDTAVELADGQWTWVDRDDPQWDGVPLNAWKSDSQEHAWFYSSMSCAEFTLRVLNTGTKIEIDCVGASEHSATLEINGEEIFITFDTKVSENLFADCSADEDGNFMAPPERWLQRIKGEWSQSHPFSRPMTTRTAEEIAEMVKEDEQKYACRRRW